jgi:hypothetical protein
MYRILARRRARIRAVVLSNGSADCPQLVAGPQHVVDAVAPPARPRFHLDFATWYAALTPANGRAQGDRAAG